ncbi:MAG: hypothetical protein COS90_02065 [Deltaproteobacteria bacterium CG07_land_8_20_14_0_80_60_11]|nr:MAG: hypothetical protein COS90_02065 [Deltaproteobacteria bacterium CG07_land_8_20_14_0_80_60_11]
MDQENEHRTDGERPGDLPGPDFSWEDLETAKPGQLALFTPFPTVAERAFLVLARKWNVDVQAGDRNISLPREVDILALSCLLLAVEWGDKFTDVARHQMESNRGAAAARREPSWYDQLPWELCQVPFMMVSPPETIAVERLTVNLDHHSGSIRCWMMEIGWIARSWLSTPEAIPLLLKNLADTLGGPFNAAGLAAAIVSTEEEFWTLARDFKYDRFAEQYAHRLKLLEEHGIFDIQAFFWKLEAQCRKVIGDAVLGLRLVPPGPPGTSYPSGSVGAVGPVEKPTIVTTAGDASTTLVEPEAPTREELVKLAKMMVPGPAELAKMSEAEIRELAAKLEAAGIDATMFSLKDIPPTGDPGKGTNSS